MNILITGADGQLGNEIKAIANNYPGLNFIYTDKDTLDITNIEECAVFFEKNKINFVINCAAYTAVDKAQNDVFLSYLLNASSVKNLVETCKKHECYFLHISTDYVFSGNSFMPYTEECATDPQSEYGLSKLEGERIALQYNKSIVIRTSWLYSNYGGNFVKTMLKLGKERESLNVVFDQIGTPTYAHNLAQVLLHIIETTIKTKTIHPGLYHYSNEGVCSWYDFACRIFALSKTECKVFPIETKDYPTLAKRPHYSVFNKKKIKTTYNIEIPHWHSSLEEMLKLELE